MIGRATLLLAILPALRGQPGPAGFHADSNLVLVPVTVTDRGGAYIDQLPREKFSILDDRRPQPISTFYGTDAPCALGIVLDISGSVKDHLTDQKQAARAAAEALDSHDPYFLMTVSSSPAMRAGLGSDPSAISDSLLTLSAGGWTALYDTIRDGVAEVRRSPIRRRALLVISDGSDNHSRTTKAELIRLLEEADVRLYAIAVESSPASRKPIERLEEQRGFALLDDLARSSGGLCLHVRSGGQAPAEAGHRIANALRNQYILGYQSPSSGSRKWHKIQVKVDRQHSNVYARSGYREP
jgi:Ca-activated chloride channel family protein